VFTGLALLVLSLAPCSAKPTFPPIVAKTYTLKPGGVVSNAVQQCTFCHVNSGPPDLNPYGLDVKNALKAANAEAITPEILHSLDKRDSDGDGFTNGDEIAADTLPGDPSSKPAGSPAAKPGGAGAATSATESAESGSFLTSAQHLLFPKHAQHPVIVHFPIALFIISLFFDLLALRGGAARQGLNTAAYYNLIVAALGAIGAVATGLMAWQFAFAGAALKGNLLLHLILSSLVAVVAVTMWAIRARQAGGPAGTPGKIYWILGILGLAMLVVTGHLGGMLSGVDTP
jgi:uncharacterized membrane protein